jgi:hypothetical protein
MSKWVYSRFEEDYTGVEEYDTREEAIEAATEEYLDSDVEGFFVGKIKPYESHKDIVDVERILEQVSEAVYDDMGEFAEYYLHDVKREHEDELEKELNEVFHKWIEKYNYQPTFFEVVDIENVSMPPYSNDDYEDAENNGLDLDNWNDYVKYYGLGEKEEY